jgi:hypothetical protein
VKFYVVGAQTIDADIVLSSFPMAADVPDMAAAGIVGVVPPRARGCRRGAAQQSSCTRCNAAPCLQHPACNPAPAVQRSVAVQRVQRSVAVQPL